MEHEGKSVYLADLNGSILSLVHFGDELLARSTRLTRISDEEAWVSVSDKVPAVGTKVTLRLRPVDSDNTKEEIEHAQ